MKNLDNILNLLDDKDVYVRQMVDKYVIGRGYLFLDLLKQSLDIVKTKENEKFLYTRMNTLVEKFVLDAFSKDDGSLWIDMGIYYLDSIYNPLLCKEDFDKYCSEIVTEVLSEVNVRQTAVEQILIFHHIFFHRFNIRMAGLDSNNLSSPSVYDTFVNKKGAFLTVLATYFLVARLSGLPIFPIKMPRQGFTIAYCEKEKPLVLLEENCGEIVIRHNDASAFYEDLKNILTVSELKQIFSPFYADKVVMDIFCESLIKYFAENEIMHKVNLLSKLRSCLNVVDLF